MGDAEFCDSYLHNVSVSYAAFRFWPSMRTYEKLLSSITDDVRTKMILC